MPVYVARNIELLTHALSGFTIISIPNKEPKHRSVWTNTGHLHGNPTYGPGLSLNANWC